MEIREFARWTSKFPGIIPVLEDIRSNNGNTRIGICKLIQEINTAPLDSVLSTVPITLYKGCITPTIYAVWPNEPVSHILGEEVYSGNYYPDEEGYVPWQEDIQLCPVKLRPLYFPVASYFVDIRKYNVNYLVLILRTGNSREIHGLSITIHERRSPAFDLEFAALEVMAAFQNGGYHGLEDLDARIETGVGC